MLRIKDENGVIIDGLYRTECGSIINDDLTAYNKYMQEKQNLEQINNLSADMDNLKSEMTDIKSLLVEFLNKVNK